MTDAKKIGFWDFWPKKGAIRQTLCAGPGCPSAARIGATPTRPDAIARMVPHESASMAPGAG